MKKILILAYDFPPYISVGGLRPYGWYKYFHEYGFYPIVITRQWQNKYENELDYVDFSIKKYEIQEENEYGLIIKSPYFPNLSNRLLIKYGLNKFKAIRKVISGFYEIAQFFFKVGPKSQLYFSAKKYLKKHNVDYIIATGEPFILFKYAKELSKKNNIPWISDYRDAWSYANSYNKLSILKFFHLYQEKKIVKDAKMVTTVSQLLKKQIEKVTKHSNIEVIENGYENEIVKIAEKIKQFDKTLNIGFMGTIYPYHPANQVLETILLINQKNERNKIILNLYGIKIHDQFLIDNDLYQATKQYINIYPKLDTINLTTELSKNNLVLLFNDYAFLGTKIFTYLAIKRKIIFCFKNDPESNQLKKNFYKVHPFNCDNEIQEKFITNTNSGIIVNNKNDLFNVLTKEMNEHYEKKHITIETSKIELFSRKHKTKILANKILNQ